MPGTQNRKKRRGDRYDAWLVRDLDPLQGFMNYVMGTRTDNEALCHLDVDMTELNRYIERKNAENPNPVFKYTFFHAVLAAIARTVDARPKLNYFIRNRKFYERKVISFAFIAKKQKIDGGQEELIITNYKTDSELSAIEQLHNSTCKMVSEIRNEKETKVDDTTKIMSALLKFPQIILRPVVWLILSLDRHGRLPHSFVKANPYQTTCFVSNLGSIKMDAQYHHLVNFGTNSLFVIVGRKEEKPVYNEDGTFELREFLPLSITLDERIADGIYYAKSLQMIKALLLRPELLDVPANQSIDFDRVLEELASGKSTGKAELCAV